MAAVLALLALDAKRRKTFVAYAFIEALITLAKKHTSLADVKHIGTTFSLSQIAQPWHAP